MENYDNPSFLSNSCSIEEISTCRDVPYKATPKVIDFFELEMGSIVGEGSFGYVRFGRWRGMGVAVKLLKENIKDERTEIIDRQKYLDELKHEVAAMTKVCNHAFVVQLVGVVFQPIPCIVTTYYEYGSLEDLLVKNKKAIRDSFSYQRLLQFANESCLGVNHLHLEGVIHRDLAARNLLLDQNFHVRVSDFGFSRFKECGASKGYTQSTVGPIRWTAPEAMRKRVYSEASDVFSLGVVLFELFVQRIPWEGCETIDVAFRVCSGERMDIPSTVPDAIRQLMLDCWNQDPLARPTLPSVVERLEREILVYPPLTPDPLLAAIAGAFANTPHPIVVESASSNSTVETSYADFSTLPSESSGCSFNTLDTSASVESRIDQSPVSADQYVIFPHSSALHSTKTSQLSQPTDMGYIESATSGSDKPEYSTAGKSSLLLQTDTTKITDTQFLEYFFANKLRSWGHESMLRLIYLLLQRSGRTSKTVREIFEVLRTFQKDGFHVTITYFWIQLITYAIEVCKQDVMVAVFNVDNSEARLLQLSFMEFILQPHCAELRDSHLYLRYYSQSCIDSGNYDFQMPDRQQLPSTVNLKDKSSLKQMQHGVRHKDRNLDLLGT